METPQQVIDSISKLDASDQEIIWKYIETLGGTIPTDSKPKSSKKDEYNDDNISQQPPPPPMYESGEDYDLATTYKMEATDLKSNGDYTSALEKYNLAVTSAPPSALLLANRAHVLLALEQYQYAVKDCDVALDLNPDSAKAMRIRGKAYKSLGEYEKSRHDLSAAQQIDYDDGTAEDLKFVTEKMREIEAEIVHQRLEEEEKLRKKAEEIKKAREEARRREEEEEANEAKASSGMGGMPNMPGGMGGMPNMPGGMGGMQGLLSALMSDPELATAMQNPKVMTALTSMMSNPGKAMEMMNDPDVGPVLQKLMAKLGPMMGGMPGAGMGGMPDFGGANDNSGGMDDMPDLDDLPDLE